MKNTKLPRIIFEQSTNQYLRSMTELNDNGDLIRTQKGYWPVSLRNIKIEIRHLLFIYITKTTRMSERYGKPSDEIGINEFCLPTSFLAEELSCSVQHIQRNMKVLLSDNLISDTGKRMNGNKVYKIMINYDNRMDHLVPISLIITPYITTSLKLFLLKIQFLMEPTINDVYTFNSKRELRTLVNDAEVINNNLKVLEDFGLIQYNKENQIIIKLKEVYSTIAEDYITKEYSKRLDQHRVKSVSKYSQKLEEL
jgi:hypothetical protein